MGNDNVPYWRDVGTIDSYWEASMEMTKVIPDLNMYDQEWPIWTHQEQLFSFHGFRFEVVARKDNRVTRIKIRPLQ